jgi:hypothetical protein
MKSKLLIYFIPVILSAFLLYGYGISDDPSNRDAHPDATLLNQSKVTNVNINDDMFDILRNHNVDSLITVAQGYGVVWTGSYYIVSQFNANMLFKISADWTLIESFPVINSTLPAANGYRNMVMAKGFLWGAAAGSVIYKVDTATKTQVGVINLPGGTQARCLAWDPVRHGFWVSTASFGGFLRCFDTTGVAIPGTDIPASIVPGGFYGTAHDNVTTGGPYLWVATDPLPRGASIFALKRFNVSAAPTLVDSVTLTAPLTAGAPNLASGGLNFATNLIPGKTTLVNLVQGAPDRVLVLEVEEQTPSGGQITICRNGLNIPIPDNGHWGNPARDSIVVAGIPAGMQITKIKVTLDTVLHTWIGDMIGYIQKGTVADTLFSRIGRPLCGATFGNSCDDLIGTNLVDSTGLTSIQDIPCTCVGINAQATGHFTAKDPLSVFQNNSIDPNGSYYLNIGDFAAGDLGSIRAWCLTIDYDVISGISNNINIADSYSLSQNYPNPFNPVTKINFSIPKSGLVTLKVFDILGKEVATLVNEVRNAGEHTVDFNALNLPSGAYFYRIEAGDFKAVKKMLLLK